MLPYSMKFEKKAKIKIKFQKMKGTFLDSNPWLKSHQPPLVYIQIEKELAINYIPGYYKVSIYFT